MKINGFTLTDMQNCVDREVSFRKRIYPRRAQNKSISASSAHHDIGCMNAVRIFLTNCAAKIDAKVQRIERLRGALKWCSGRLFDRDDNEGADEALRMAGDMDDDAIANMIERLEQSEQKS